MTPRGVRRLVWAVCGLAGLALGTLRVAPWLTRSDHEARAERLRAMLSATGGADPADAAFALETLTHSGDLPASLRALAASALARAEPRGGIALPRVLEACDDGRPEVRHAATAALGQMGAAGLAPERAHPALRARLDDAAPAVRASAATALGMFGPAGRDAADALYARRADPDFEVRQSALWAWSRVAPADPRLVPGLIEALADPAPKVRLRASQLLGSLGAPAAAALDALEGAAADADAAVRQAAKHAAEQIRQATRPR